MKCPSCNNVIPDNSKFCTNCGSVFQSKVSEVQLHNTNLPTEIFYLSVWFEKGMEKITRKGLFGGVKDTGKISRNMNFAFQLIDADKNTTAYNGDIRMKVKVFQGYYSDNQIHALHGMMALTGITSPILHLKND